MVIRERGSVLYLGMAQEFWDFAIARHGLNTCQQQPVLQRDSRSLDHHCSTLKRTFEYAGGEKNFSQKGHFCLLSSSSSHNELSASIAHKLRQL